MIVYSDGFGRQFQRSVGPLFRSDVDRAGVINMTTTAARPAPPAATADAPPTALNAAAPAAPLLAGSVIVTPGISAMVVLWSFVEIGCHQI